MIVRVIPHVEGFMLQRYRPDFDDWCNMKLYDDKRNALSRASKYQIKDTNFGNKDSELDSKM